jgi:hypothetical protein
MHLVLRDLDSGLFYSTTGWIQSLALAHRFGERSEAEEVAKTAGLKQAEISILIDGGVVGGTPIQPAQKDEAL